MLELVSKTWHTCKARLMGVRLLSRVKLMLWVWGVTILLKNKNKNLFSKCVSVFNYGQSLATNWFVAQRYKPLDVTILRWTSVLIM